MQAALDSIHQGTSDLFAADVALVAVDDLGLHILSIQTETDRLRVVQSKLMLEADRHRIWFASGHRSIEAWLAANGKTTVAAASKQKRLGEALDKSAELADAVDAGEITPDTAVALLPALGADHSGDVAELVDACKGATPAEARDAGNMFQELNPPTDQTDAEREHAKRQKRSLRFADNANIQRLLISDSVPLDLGRSKRLASGDQFTALLARDGGCRFPGCNMPADWCEVDHILEWTDQYGPTDLRWLVLWCVYHHHFRHRPDVHLHGDADSLSITLPDGRTMPLPARGPTAQPKAA